MAPSPMSGCESTRGQWSTPTKQRKCPDCGAVMPIDYGPLKSWMATRAIDASLSANARINGALLRYHEKERLMKERGAA